MDTTTRIAIDRIGAVAAAGGTATPQICAAILAECARHGVRILNPEAVTDSLAATIPETLAHIRHRRGERGTFSPLFPGFPDALPSFDIAEMRFLLGAVRLLGTAGTDDDIRAAMDFSAVDWWPASSVPQDIDQAELDRAVQRILPGDTRTELFDLRIVADIDAELRTFAQNALAGAASLREDVRADVALLLDLYGTSFLDMDRVRFRESRTIVLRAAWSADPANIVGLGAGPDDLLRLFADLTGGDVSLTEPIKFPKLTRAQRRAVCAALEASDRLCDMYRRRGLWLAVSRGLHVRAERHPNTHAALSALRNDRRDRTALGSRYERALGDDAGVAATILAGEAPGLLGRQLRRILSLAASTGTADAVLEAVADAADTMPVRVLLAARAQIADNGATYPRVAFGKRGAAMTIPHKPGHLQVDGNLRDRILAVLDNAVAGQLAAKGSWDGEVIHVDPALTHVLIPEQLRSTAQGLIQVERGTRLPLGDATVLRLFIHWRETADGPTSDLDLSCIALDEHFGVRDQVSWTNLANGAMVHSGDLTSAPAGAQEFLDVNLAKAKREAAQRGWRYLVPSIFRYAGPAFGALEEAYAGWMLRDAADRSRATFDPATVQNAFALTGAARVAVPFLVDLLTDEVLYLDVYLHGHAYARVERDGTTITDIAAAVAARRRVKASVAELVALHADARGGRLTDDPAEATITVGVTDTATYNALRPEKLLADLL